MPDLKNNKEKNMNTLITSSNDTASVVTARSGEVRGWLHWTPYAAVVWSIVYAAVGAYWVISGRGFPYASELMNGITDPVVGRFGPVVAWVVVIALGIPAAALER